MSTLFFDGFDRGVLLKNLDPNYWSTSLKNYPRYSFGAFTYDNNTILENETYNIVYKTYENNSIRPPGPFSSFYMFYGIDTPNYPGFGIVPGFLALNNIPINNNQFNISPLGYVQISGFPEISGTKSFFGIRCLGIETKDSSFVDSEIGNGRFENRHPFLAFCSGNITGLLLSFVRISGETLLPLRMQDDSIDNPTGPRYSIGLLVEQNDSNSGIFDLNVSDTISNYRITPVYCDNNFFSNGIPSNSNFNILTIADSTIGGLPSDSNFQSSDRLPEQRVISRWTHFEIGLDHSGGYLQLKIENADALVVDDTNEDRESWEISVPISGFYYDNIKIFNRTYNSGLFLDSLCNFPVGTGRIINNTHYYANGSLTLIDDVTLVDNTGTEPTFFLGKDSKVLPLNPGSGLSNISIFNDNNITYDGPFQWNKEPTNKTNKSILASYDGDVSKIFESEKEKINVNMYSNSYAQISSGSLGSSKWRYDYNDAVGGIKVYNTARKEFLDTGFVNIVAKTDYVAHDTATKYLLHLDTDKIIDSSLYYHKINLINNVSIVPDSKFSSGISLSNNGFLIIEDTYDIKSGEFTLESWIKLEDTSHELVLFDKKYKSDIPTFSITDAVQKPLTPVGFSSQGGRREEVFGYSFSININFLNIKSWYSLLDDTICDKPATLKLNLPFALNTGVWYHIALTKNNINNSGYFNIFVNGISGTGYTSENIYVVPNNSISIDKFLNCSGNSLDLSANSPKIFPLTFTTSNNDSFASHFGVLSSDLRFISGFLPAIKSFPYAYIHGTGYVDEYRFSTGTPRYITNFTPPTEPFIGALDGFSSIGPEHNLTRTNYRILQFYQMNHPDSMQPFSIEELNNGFRLGVKKL